MLPLFFSLLSVINVKEMSLASRLAYTQHSPENNLSDQSYFIFPRTKTFLRTSARIEVCRLVVYFGRFYKRLSNVRSRIALFFTFLFLFLRRARQVRSEGTVATRRRLSDRIAAPRHSRQREVVPSSIVSSGRQSPLHQPPPGNGAPEPREGRRLRSCAISRDVKWEQR